MKIRLSSEETKFNVGEKVFVRALLHKKDNSQTLPYFVGEVSQITLKAAFVPQHSKFGELLINTNPYYRVKPDSKYHEDYHIITEFHAEFLVFLNEDDLFDK